MRELNVTARDRYPVMENVNLENGRSSTSGDAVASNTSTRWMLMGSKIPKAEIVFFTQVILIYIVVIASLVNIALGSTAELWVLLLTSCLGYLMPSPSLKKNNKNDGEYVHNAP